MRSLRRVWRDHVQHVQSDMTRRRDPCADGVAYASVDVDAGVILRAVRRRSVRGVKQGFVVTLGRKGSAVTLDSLHRTSVYV